MASTQGIRAGRAFVELFTDNSKLVRGLRGAEKQIKAFGNRIRNMGLKMAGLGTALLAPLAGAAKYFSSYGDQVAKMAKRTGLSVEALSEMQFVASQSGTSIETLETGFRRMQRSIYDAGRGLSTQTDALADLGLKYKDLNGLAPEEQFKVLADAISKVEDPTRRAALAQAMFGRAGTQLIPMMADGAEGIEKLQEEARRLGQTMSGKDAKAAEDFTDAMDKLWKTVKMGVFHIGAALAPTLQAAAEKLAEVVAKISAWIKSNRELIVIVAKVATGILAAGVGIAIFGTIISGLGSVIGGVISVITAFGVALKIVGTVLAFLVSPIGLVVAALVALGAYMIHTSGAGGKAISWLGEKFSNLAEDAKKAFGGIADALAAGDIALAAQILWGTLKLWWLKGTEGLRRIWIDFKAGFVKVFAEAFYGGLKVARKVWEWLEIGWAETTAFFSTAWYAFVGFFQRSWERIKAGAKKAWNWIKSLFDDSIDLEAENKLVEQEKQKAVQSIDNETAQRIVERDKKRQADRQQIETESNDFSRQQDEKKEQLKQAADEVAAQEQDALTKRITELKRQRDEAIQEARQKRQAKGDGGPEVPDTSPDKFKGLGDRIAEQVQKVSVAGAFDVSSILSLQAGDAADRTAQAAEETSKNTKQLVQQGRDAEGLSFG